MLRVDEPLVPIWRGKNKHLNLNGLDKGITNYLDSLPKDIQENIYITSATEGKHAENSRHGKGRAVDIRIDQKAPLNDPFFLYLGKTTEERKKNKIVVLDPLHGLKEKTSSAAHIHLSYGNGTENNLDYFYGTKSKNDEHDHESQSTNLQTPTESQPIGLQSIPSNINYDMINEFKKLIEETKKVSETEKDNTALIEAKNKLTERDNAVKFIKELKLNYTQFTPGK